MQRNLPKGNSGERIAENYLVKKGFRIIDRNFRVRYGEIDLIALYQNNLIFVEVKTRWGTIFGRPEEAITAWKLKTIIKTAEYFKLLHPELPDSLRIDAVGVQLNERGNLLNISHFPNVTS